MYVISWAASLHYQIRRSKSTRPNRVLEVGGMANIHRGKSIHGVTILQRRVPWTGGKYAATSQGTTFMIISISRHNWNLFLRLKKHMLKKRLFRVWVNSRGSSWTREEVGDNFAEAFLTIGCCQDVVDASLRIESLIVFNYKYKDETPECLEGLQCEDNPQWQLQKRMKSLVIYYKA